MKNTIFPSLLLLLFASCGNAVAQEFNPFFGDLPAGSTKTFVVLNEQGTQDYYYTETLGDMRSTPQGTSFSITTQMYENDGRPSVNGRYTDNYTIEDGKVVNRIKPGDYGNGIKGEYQSGQLPWWPDVLSAGKTLASYRANIAIRFEVLGNKNSETGAFTCSDRRVDAQRTVRTPAGAYLCYQLHEKHSTVMGKDAMSGMPSTVLTTSISEDIGVVAIHEVFEDGSPFLTTVLRSIGKPAGTKQ